MALPHPYGTVGLLEADPDLMFGADETTARPDHAVELADGDTLLLYTGGLIKR